MHSCGACGYKSEKKTKLKKHIVLRHSPNVHSCGACGYKSEKKANVKRHILLRHSPSSTKYMECENCKRFYGSVKTLRRHNCMKNKQK